MRVRLQELGEGSWFELSRRGVFIMVWLAGGQELRSEDVGWAFAGYLCGDFCALVSSFRWRLHWAGGSCLKAGLERWSVKARRGRVLTAQPRRRATPSLRCNTTMIHTMMTSR